MFPSACPCCGYDTIDRRGDYDICGICWWEDDGQDNETANTVNGGPNSLVSLTRARLNFLSDGIYNPLRSDLRSQQLSTTSQTQIRYFIFNSETLTISEPKTGWSTTLAELDDNPARPYYSVGDPIIYRRRWLDKETKLGTITHIEWQSRALIWRYRLTDDAGSPVHQWFDGADLHSAEDRDE